ncbi:DUF4166 domain-containing protein [Salinithrix halophila]|uniref:DUF4166 domain-containing protein n=1 Tax=Salinithrix halophila TaxID=1485204 RepID=A0ABV8JLG9_9BACL
MESQIPFTVRNFAYRDPYGRETVTWSRRFHLGDRVRRFDATMIYSRQRGVVVDYLGTHQHLAVDIQLSVAPNGGLYLRSKEQRFYEGGVQFRFPRWLTGEAEVCEWYDEEAERYRIRVLVTNPLFGPVFGYQGSFRANVIRCASERIPSDVKPLRTEWRE